MYWSQEAVRLAATAIRENWSNDVYKLARVAAEALIRNDADLIELLNATKPAPSVASTPVHATAVHA